MRVLEPKPFSEVIAGYESSAVHLEMHGMYTPSDPSYQAFVGSGPPFDRTERERGWRELLGPAVARGVKVRRARIISEPVTDYIRYEHAVTPSMNLAAGEEVRWLPRRNAADFALPGADFWLFDGGLVKFHHFAGDGTHIEDELTDDPAAVNLCSTAFELVWSRAIDHAVYQLR